jgi:hypothetical protein
MLTGMLPRTQASLVGSLFGLLAAFNEDDLSSLEDG